MIEAPIAGRGGAEFVAPEFLERERARIEEALAIIRTRVVEQLDRSLRDPVEYALSTSGKRLRPILAVLAYAAAQPGRVPIPASLYRLGCALEIVHTYSLVHDDLPCMDDDDLRRGRPTVHRVFGIRRATLAGAALLPIAMEVLEKEARALGLSLTERARLMIELANAAGAPGMVGGQLLDLRAEQREIGGAELERIHRLKTGALLTCALRVGAHAGRAQPELVEALTDYGRALGLAFQITDDVLDVEGSAERLGKAAGRDLALKKASYPGLFGLENARRLGREKVAEAKRALVGHDLPELIELADYVVERHT